MEEAIGQYSLYHLFLQRHDPERRLYLAIPIHAFENILSREVGRVAIEGLGIHVIVYPLSEEELCYGKLNRVLQKSCETIADRI